MTKIYYNSRVSSGRGAIPHRW